MSRPYYRKKDVEIIARFNGGNGGVSLHAKCFLPPEDAIAVAIDIIEEATGSYFSDEQVAMLFAHCGKRAPRTRERTPTASDVLYGSAAETALKKEKP